MSTSVRTKPYRGSPSTLWFLAVYLVISSRTTQSATPGTANILIYSATMGYRHDSIPSAVDALISRSASHNITFEHTEEVTWFREETLQKYDAIVFLSTTGEVLDSEGKIAFQSYLDKGGNFVGIHSASDSLNTTTFYGQEVGAYFDYHPPISNATVDILTKDHLSTNALPDRWEVTDEMYNFKSDPRNVGAVVILSANESSYLDPGPRRFDQGQPHPTAWYQERGAGVQNNGTPGRSFYTSLGHLNETWHDELFLSHIFGGITWTLGSGTTKYSNHSATLGLVLSNLTNTNSSTQDPPWFGGDDDSDSDKMSSGFFIFEMVVVGIAGSIIVGPFVVMCLGCCFPMLGNCRCRRDGRVRNPRPPTPIPSPRIPRDEPEMPSWPV